MILMNLKNEKQVLIQTCFVQFMEFLSQQSDLYEYSKHYKSIGETEKHLKCFNALQFSEPFLKALIPFVKQINFITNTQLSHEINPFLSDGNITVINANYFYERIILPIRFQAILNSISEDDSLGNVLLSAKAIQEIERTMFPIVSYSNNQVHPEQLKSIISQAHPEKIQKIYYRADTNLIDLLNQYLKAKENQAFFIEFEMHFKNNIKDVWMIISGQEEGTTADYWGTQHPNTTASKQGCHVLAYFFNKYLSKKIVFEGMKNRDQDNQISKAVGNYLQSLFYPYNFDFIKLLAEELEEHDIQLDTQFIFDLAKHTPNNNNEEILNSLRYFPNNLPNVNFLKKETFLNDMLD